MWLHALMAFSYKKMPGRFYRDRKKAGRNNKVRQGLGVHCIYM